ncbi:MAG TPA: hypothetical protein VGH67_21110 [Solirubrobacteraceae bacterium]|jgi:hypothetical protein
MEAQHRIAGARSRAGVSDAEIDRALEASEPFNAAALTEEALYRATLESFVAALGGRLQGAAAVFGDETIALPGAGGDAP